MSQMFIDLLQYFGILGTLHLINQNTRAIGVLIQSLRLLDERFSAEDIAELRDMARRSRETREYKQKAREEVAARMAEKEREVAK